MTFSRLNLITILTGLLFVATSASASEAKPAPSAAPAEKVEKKEADSASLEFPKKGDICILSASMNRVGDNVPSELVELSCDGATPKVQARDGKNQDVNQTLSRELASAKKAGWKISQCSYVNAFNPERGPYSYFDFKKMICILSR